MFHLPAAVRKYYQGTSLCRPFFFLLVDSVFGFAAQGWPESLLLPSLFGLEQSPSALAAAAEDFAAPVPGAFAAVPLAAAVGVVVALALGVEGPAAEPLAGEPDDPVTDDPGAPAGAWLGNSEGAEPTTDPEVPVIADGIPSGDTPGSDGDPASGTSSDGAVAPAGTVSTAVEFSEPPTVLPAMVLPAAVGLSTSPASISLGGFRLGLPPFAAWVTSGLLLTAAKPRRMTVGCGSLEALCLASCRRASAAGSGCGTGTPAAMSRLLASAL